MLFKEHFLEIFVNGQKLEINQKDINLRLNNVLFDPSKISSTQAEYSFEISAPSTPKNDKIFDYANNLSKLNKFRRRLNAEVYADGNKIFTGTITLNGFKNKQYSCNLVSVKVYSLEDIFGDKTMSQINWKVPFEGSGVGDNTINWYNSQSNGKFMFPLASYGVFQKFPKFKDDVAAEYTSKFDLDEYNSWHIEDFYPSHNMLETLKKAFESVDYNVAGDAFSNINLKNIFLSTNLADGQDPEYNVGNEKFGKIDLSATFRTNSTAGYVQDLKFPYYKVGGTLEYVEGKWEKIDEAYNLEAVQLYDILSEGTVTINQPTSYMYQPNEHIIVVPADGFYKIDMDISTVLLTSEMLTAELNIRELGAEGFPPSVYLKNEIVKQDVEFRPNISTTTPIEIQLVRNYDDNLELIKGRTNVIYVDGNPNHIHQGDWPELDYNMLTYYTCFPHEKLGYFSDDFPIPTKTDDLGSKEQYTEKDTPDGYVYHTDPYSGPETMCYDPIVNKDFICGFSSMGHSRECGCYAIIKDGYSWSKQVSERYNAFYRSSGYDKITRDGHSHYPYYDYIFTPTDYHKNELLNSDFYFSETATGGRMEGRLNAIVYLHKNDKLQLFCVHRDYNNAEGDKVLYDSSTSVNLKIQAYSPKSYIDIKNKGYNDFALPTQFDTELNLANFLNKEKKISEWVQNIADAFNLEILQEGKNVMINTKKLINHETMAAVDIDDRVNSADAEISAINYPRSMAVKYKIDKDEWGFERSAVEAAGGDESILDEEGWEKYADSGYTVIELNDDSYATSTNDKSLQFSYTWYQDFNWYAVNSSGEKTSDTPITLRLPCISKFSYMIDGYDYEESMKHDGYGLAQRFWFTPQQTPMYVWTNTYPAERVIIYQPTNLYTNYSDINLNLSYKTSENSILTEFFNYMPYLASNYVEVDAYITADEYNRLKNGALIHFDSDLYIVVEISGYDCTGHNPTTIKMMTKV